MNQSTNYNFNIPEGTDLVNLLTQLIPNWNSLDTILKGVQDSTFQNATETVSLGVHAITRLNPDAKLLKWIATANFEAGDTFTIDGIATPASLPSGEALGEDSYIAGSVVIAALNADESALTVYVTTGTIAVASDSERLGGELPAYYATKTYADGIKSTADAASELITKKALVNTYYNSSDKKLYQVNADGTVGGEINMLPELDFANAVDVTVNGITTNTNGALIFYVGGNVTIYVDNKSVGWGGNAFTEYQTNTIQNIAPNSVIKISANLPTNAFAKFVPYK